MEFPKLRIISRNRQSNLESSFETLLFLFKIRKYSQNKEEKMRKTIWKSTLALVVIAATLLVSACGGSTSEEKKAVKIAVPNDTTNEARALLLLQANELIELKDGAGIAATPRDVAKNPHNIEFFEVEAAQLPSVLVDVDFAVINSNYAIDAGLNPVKDSIVIEGLYSAYGNIIAVKEGNEKNALVQALVAAVESKQVADFIAEKYAGGVVSVVENPTDGYNPEIDYEALKGQTISVAASPAPHAEILGEAAKILEKVGVTLNIVEFTDYVQPNLAVENGDVDANYFQHQPYLDDFNAEQDTHIVSVSVVHVEPMGLYGGKLKSLDDIK